MQNINININYQDHKFILVGLENCGVTKLLLSKGEFYELGLLEALKKHIVPNSYIVDIGANIGNHTLFFNKVMRANVLAIEPNPKTYLVLKKNLELNNLTKMTTALNVAISNKKGVETLSPNATADPGSFSILGKQTKDSFQCKSLTLDGDYKTYFKSHPPSLIKIDVEGSEAMILSAATKTLETYKPILAIESMTEIEFNAVAEIISPLGYYPVGIYNATPTVIWECGPGGRPTNALLDIFRYAIGKADALNKSSFESKILLVQNKNYKTKLLDLESRVLETSPTTETSSKSGKLIQKAKVLETSPTTETSSKSVKSIQKDKVLGPSSTTETTVVIKPDKGNGNNI